MFKRFMRSKAVQVTLGFILAAYMQLVRYTTRWDIQRADVAAPITQTPKGFIGLTWHSRFMMLNSVKSRIMQKPHLLISLSRDGAIVAHTTHFLGMPTIRGSARKVKKRAAKGGAKASRDIMKVLEGNNCVVITPDGPRGPRQRLGDGPLRLARLTGVPVISCIFATKWRVQFNSWDRFNLPLPFGKGKIIWGTPLQVPEAATDEELEDIRLRMETEMNAHLAKADTELGHDVIEPAT